MSKVYLWFINDNFIGNEFSLASCSNIKNSCIIITCEVDMNCNTYQSVNWYVTPASGCALWECGNRIKHDSLLLGVFNLLRKIRPKMKQFKQI